MDEDLIEYKLYQIIDQFNERKITPAKFYSKQTKSIHFMMEMVERVIYRLLNDKIIKLNDRKKNLKTNNIKRIFIVSNAQSLQKITALK